MSTALRWLIFVHAFHGSIHIQDTAYPERVKGHFKEKEKLKFLSEAHIKNRVQGIGIPWGNEFMSQDKFNSPAMRS